MIEAIKQSIIGCYGRMAKEEPFTDDLPACDAEIAYLDGLVRDAKIYRALRLVHVDAQAMEIWKTLFDPFNRDKSVEEVDAFHSEVVAALEAAGYTL